MKKKSLALIVWMVPLLAFAQFEQPFKWDWDLSGKVLTVAVQIPESAYLYVESTTVTVEDAENITLSPQSEPVGQEHTDELGTYKIYEGEQEATWTYSVLPDGAYRISIDYQGCGAPEGGGGAVCFPPESIEFKVGDVLEPLREGVAEAVDSIQKTALDDLLDRFDTVKVGGGVMSVPEMLDFLDLEHSETSPDGLLAARSIWLMLLLIILGGMALNLTPCVLPMIPINLAIIGAGAQASSKLQGFIRGGVYGLGIALAYGGLGVFTVLTGAKFGTLNSSAIFNFVIAGIFVVLSLAMFDLLSIDLSRFSARFGTGTSGRGKLIPAFLMGVVAALLAGACVAPIVIAVLLHATKLYSSGVFAAIFLPLVLGVGMALPWPVAGAGLTVLPKPGAWMVRVKQVFGILILLFSAYYIYLGVELLPSGNAQSDDSPLLELQAGLEKALDENKPVFIDFWASWCKNCLKMDATTFKDSTVKDRLHDFTEIKFAAEKVDAPEIKRILDRYELVGLPGYVILTVK